MRSMPTSIAADRTAVRFLTGGLKRSLKALAFAAVLIPARGVVAQSISAPVAKSDWGNLRMLMSGAEIRVNTTGHKTIRGTIQSVTADELIVELIVNQPSGSVMLARNAVTSVSLKKQGHRVRHMLIGLGVGGAAGLAVGAKSDCSGCISPVGPNFGKEVLTPIGAIVGLGIGAALPAGGWREIYRTP
jgi:hypothetical protein